MLRIFSVLGFLFREIFFKDPSEYDFKSPKFNARRVAMAGFLVLLVASNVILLERLFVVGAKNVRLKEMLRQCLDKSQEDSSSNSAVQLPPSVRANAPHAALPSAHSGEVPGCKVYKPAITPSKTSS